MAGYSDINSFDSLSLVMPTRTTPNQVLPDNSAQNKPLWLDVQPKQTSVPTHEPELLFAPPMAHTATSFANDYDYDTISAVPQNGDAEDEYTLCAYGDISLSEVIIPPLPASTHPHSSQLEPRYPQPRLRLKVRRPPMPKRRTSYTCIPDPLACMEPDDRWPGSPRSFANDSPWAQHQPLVSPLPDDIPTSRTRGSKPIKNGDSSLERLFDELVPRSPSIRLSPPGSPASQALSLPRETQSGVREGRGNAAKQPHSSPTPAPRQDKPKEAPWKTRLPPRLPIPKWDM